jgi:transcriptional regulator with XRE-family HTH domain
MNRFGDALRQARDAAGLSIRALMRKSRVHYTTISVAENGHNSPRMGTIRKLAKPLGVEFRCSERGWSTGPVGEADELREGLAEALDLADGTGGAECWGDEEFAAFNRLRKLAGMEG